MATLKLSIVLFLSFSYAATAASTTPTSLTAAVGFIRTACNNYTTFSGLCIGSLKPKAVIIGLSRENIATVALGLSLDRTISAELRLLSFARMRGLKEADYEALATCLEVVSDGVDQLNSSLSEMKSLGSPGSEEREWRASNMMTWTSAAMTNVYTCKDLMANTQLEGHIRSFVKNRMSYVAKVVSNSLALCNNFVAGN